MQSSKRKGILAGGNWIIDQIKIVDDYPEEERLVNIQREYSSNGGAPYNVLKALFKMEAPFPLEAVGVIGEDDRGQDVLDQCREMNINSSQLKKVKGVNTSYTDVMTVESTGKRTFFHYRGANSILDEPDFNFSISSAKIFHLGYLLLLDKLDRILPNGLTGASQVLKAAKKSGLITSADIVSEQSDRYTKIIPPSLPYIDVLFINEFEAKMLTGIEIIDEHGNYSRVNCSCAAQEILNMGVLNWVIIHFPQGAIALHKSGKEIFQKVINLPPVEIKGTVGAGDAFAAGVLTGIHEEWSMERSLQLGVGVAAASLMDATSCGSIVPWQECMEFEQKFGYSNRKLY